MDLFIVALAIIAAFYVAVRLVLRLYFPSDTLTGDEQPRCGESRR